MKIRECLIYFLQGVSSQAQDVLNRVEKLKQLIEEWQSRLPESGSNTTQKLLLSLAGNPYVTTKKAAQQLDVSFTTAQRSINKLEEQGFIVQTSVGQRDRVYCAVDILKILEEPTVVR